MSNLCHLDTERESKAVKQENEGCTSETTPVVNVKTDGSDQENLTVEETKADEISNTHEVKRELTNSEKTSETNCSREEHEKMHTSRLGNVAKLVGAHVSATGGVHNAIANSLSIG
ncbi:16102_t:CDS:1 [Acaulospora morrowiae]|uniref:16102_t:CDS:1 n=1 Tax=Acaulospora morrowiae TaxID=94023 RepID=A0A9N8VRD0_9GLOM|nr:16102_t:CDS:1 [Acaulospora morrowiae]